MPTPFRILVAVDFGPASEQALRVAGAIGEALGAEVTALHAETFDVPPYFTLEQVGTFEQQRDRLWQAAADHVVRMARRVTSRPIQARIVDGPAAAAVLAAAEDADLIVMGTHGRRGPGRWWLGSVAERVLRETARPLLVVHAGDATRTVAEHFSRPLVMADPVNQRAADLADRLAGAFGGTVVPGALPLACPPAALNAASLVVVPLGGSGGEDRLVSDAVRVLRACERPVLFVP